MGLSAPCSPVTPTVKLSYQDAPFLPTPQATVSSDEEESGEVSVPGAHIYEPSASPQGAGLLLPLLGAQLPCLGPGSSRDGKETLSP